ncbi:MAG: hypothetical protein VXW32_02435 [Myxococcota bacterium]|nr:hypothetical protein [Myxococcota bacterium]
MLMPRSIDPKSLERPCLVTIPYSHYCELSRWALERAGIEFDEAQYSPGYHAKVVGQLRSNKADRSESSYVGQESGVHGGRRKYAVPLLCLPDSRILRDSWEILDFALGPVDDAWRTSLDRELGVAVRQLGYHYLLTPESKHLLKRMIASSSLYERLLWVFIGGKVVDGMRQLLAVTPENAEKSKATVLRVLEAAGETLSERDGVLDPSGVFGPVDVAFCSLAAYTLMPDNFGNGAVEMPTKEDFPSEYQEFIERCRETPAGAYVMESYQRRAETVSG